MITVVGGSWSNEESEVKRSGLASKMAKELNADSLFNGGLLRNLPSSIYSDLIVWMPNIPNHYDNLPLKKKKGATLIITKVLRSADKDGIGDAISRIFRFNANFVICISGEASLIEFTMYDALGNLCFTSKDINCVAQMILHFYSLNKQQIRVETSCVNDSNLITDFIPIVHSVQAKVEQSRGGRYFGNASTRCEKMFPSCKTISMDIVTVTKRNIDKEKLSKEDFVAVFSGDDGAVMCMHSDKPSIDTPVQLELYKNFRSIRYIIHGHAVAKSKFQCNYSTEEYFPCGDMREVEEILSVVKDRNRFQYCINLKNHGFILMADCLFSMEKLIQETDFTMREISIPNLEVKC